MQLTARKHVAYIYIYMLYIYIYCVYMLFVVYDFIRDIVCAVSSFTD